MIRDLEPQSQLELLRKANPLLTPPALAEIIPAYSNFTELPDHNGLWSLPELPLQLEKDLASYNKVILMLSGVATGGKDAIREQIEQLQPNLMRKLVTATTRQPRSGEIHGVDYYFYSSQDEFQAAVVRGEFIEWVQQGNRFYGLPFQSLVDALKDPDPLICTHVEMSAWPVIEAFLKENSQGLKVKVIKLFVLPAVSFADYQERLKDGRNDIANRLSRTVMELEAAPKKTDLVVVNQIQKGKVSLTNIAEKIISLVVPLLKSDQAGLLQQPPLPADKNEIF